MSRVTLALVLFALVAAVFAAPQKAKEAEGSEGGSSILDNFDLDSVLNNSRVLKNYVKCTLGTGPCTAEGREMKRVLPEVLKTACGKCSPSQRDRLRRTLNKLKNDPKLVEDYNKIVQKYDPKKEYVENLEKFLLSGNKKSA